MKYTIFVISNKPHLFSEIEKQLYPLNVSFFNGENYESFSKLVNTCVSQSTSEIVVLLSDKVLPLAADIEKLLGLIEQGYALVGLYRLACFGFKKELFRKIGPFDERFVGGGYEDDDFYIRLREANLSVFLSEEVKYSSSPSSWDYSKSRPHFLEKWGDIKANGFMQRHLLEAPHCYNFGSNQYANFLPTSDSVVQPLLKHRKYLKKIPLLSSTSTNNT
jgi:predicted glycosyltransferase involved in capsule biosynthesis